MQESIENTKIYHFSGEVFNGIIESIIKKEVEMEYIFKSYKKNIVFSKEKKQEYKNLEEDKFRRNILYNIEKENF